jgi:hypothetical protein
MFQPDILPEQYHKRLPADNIEVIKYFIDCHLDVNIFDITMCANFECFMLLMNSGYAITNKISHLLLFSSCKDWDLESKKMFMAYFMDNEELSEKINMDSNVLIFASYMCPNHELKTMFSFVVQNYPIKVSAANLFQFASYADILEPAFSFSSKELVDEFSKHEFASIEKFFKYCSPEDYLTLQIFQRFFCGGNVSGLAHFVEQGYVPDQNAYPEHLNLLCLHSFNYLKSVNLWDGETFDWDAHTFPSSWKYCYAWLKNNGCPESVLSNEKQFVN